MYIWTRIIPNPQDPDPYIKGFLFFFVFFNVEHVDQLTIHSL